MADTTTERRKGLIWIAAGIALLVIASLFALARPSATDWITSIAALIAAIAGLITAIVGLMKLIKGHDQAT